MKRIVLLLLLTFNFIGVANSKPMFLVDSEWLIQNMRNEGLVIVDVRDKQDYVKGTIEGAINLAVSTTYRSGKLNYLLKEKKKIVALIGNHGITNRNLIVLVDDGSMKHAARMFWIFEFLGHERVVILNGGISNWTYNQKKLSLKQIKYGAKKFVANINNKRFADKKMIYWSIKDKNYFLVDSRPLKDFNKDHIKSALHLPITNYFKGPRLNRTLKGPKEMKVVFLPFENAKKITTYCQKGRDSSLTYFMMRRAGLNVSHYDGSWPEWKRLNK